MFWKDVFEDKNETRLSVITDVVDVLEDPRFESVHFCGSSVVYTKHHDKFVRLWDHSVDVVSRYIKADYVISEKSLDFSRSLTSYLDDHSILTADGVNFEYPPVPLPDHRRWVKNLTKLTLAFGPDSIHISCPDRIDSYVRAVLGSETDFKSPTNKAISVILYEGCEGFNPKKSDFKFVYSNMPECLDIYKIQRLGYNFSASYSGFYKLGNRGYVLP